MARVPVCVGALYAILTTKADPDLWGHLRFGLDLLQSRHLTSADPYSYTSDLPWTNHEWLSELIMGGAYASMGSAGLIILKVFVTVATLAVIASSLRRAPDSWRWPTGFLALLGILPITLTIRPQLWTLLLLALECRVLTGSHRERLWLPVMFAFWVNLHGGWIVGLGVLAVWSMVELFESPQARPSVAAIVGLGTACVLATLCNPYGWHLWEFLAATVRLSRPNILEWQPIWRNSWYSILLWTLGVVWVGAALRDCHNRPLKAVAVVAMLAFASMRVMRLLPLFIPASAILLAPHLRQRHIPDTVKWPKRRTIVDIAVACVGVLLLTWPMSPGCIQLNGTWLPDIAAARALAASNPKGRLLTWFDWGEYAIWHFGPALKVSVDGRRETVYSEAVFERQMAIAQGEPTAVGDLAHSAPEYAWLPAPRSGRTRDWLKSHGYRIDIETPESFVAVRGDLPKVERAAAASSTCFPAP